MADGGSSIDRRRFPRFQVSVAYTGMRIRLTSDDSFRARGHAIDVSEGGVRFEADVGIEPGTPVALWVDLPERNGDTGPGRAVFIMGNVVWCDVEEPGPAQMAVAVTRFPREGDRERLLRRFGQGVYARAA